MYITMKKLREIVNEYLPVISCIIDDDDLPCICDMVSEFLKAEADALEAKEPSAYASISRLRATASELYAFSSDLCNMT